MISASARAPAARPAAGRAGAHERASPHQCLPRLPLAGILEAHWTEQSFVPDEAIKKPQFKRSGQNGPRRAEKLVEAGRAALRAPSRAKNRKTSTRKVKLAMAKRASRTGQAVKRTARKAERPVKGTAKRGAGAAKRATHTAVRDTEGAAHKAEHAVGGAAHETEHVAGSAVHGTEHAAGSAVHGTEHAVGAVVHGTEHAVGSVVHGAEHVVGGAVGAVKRGVKGVARAVTPRKPRRRTRP